jgi:hypothetical protein
VKTKEEIEQIAKNWFMDGYRLKLLTCGFKSNLSWEGLSLRAKKAYIRKVEKTIKRIERQYTRREE